MSSNQRGKSTAEEANLAVVPNPPAQTVVHTVPFYPEPKWQTRTYTIEKSARRRTVMGDGRSIDRITHLASIKIVDSLASPHPWRKRYNNLSADRTIPKSRAKYRNTKFELNAKTPLAMMRTDNRPETKGPTPQVARVQFSFPDTLARLSPKSTNWHL